LRANYGGGEISLIAHSGRKYDWPCILGKNKIAAHSGKYQDYQHILGKQYDWQHFLVKQNLIDSIFWEKNDLQHILGKQHD
jgi:hypothetical protein